MKLSSTLPLLVFFAGCSSAPPPPPACSCKPASETPRRLGVVDLRRVYNEIQEVSEFTNQLEADKKRTQEEVDQVEDETERTRRIEKWNVEINRRLNEGVMDIYSRICETVDRVAEERGLELVLKMDKSPRLGSSSVDAVISGRTVLHFPDEADISEEVIRRMNEDWKAKKPK